MIPKDKETLEKIKVYLESSDNEIAIIEVNEPVKQEQIISDLKADIPRKIKIIDLKKSGLMPLEELKRQINLSNDIEIIFITNLHQLGNKSLTDAEIVTDLNFSRDLYIKLNKIIIFFLPTYFVDFIINHAPDFFDFALTFKFSNKEIDKTVDFDLIKHTPDIRYYKNRISFLELVLEENKEISKDTALKQKELAKLYYEINDKNNSLKYLTSAIKISQEIDDKLLFANIVNDAGLILIESEVLKDVLSLLNLALDILRSNNDLKGIIDIYLKLAIYYANKGDLKKSITFAEDSLRIAQDENINDKLSIYYTLSQIYNLSNDIEKSEKYLIEAYNLAKEGDDIIAYIGLLIRESDILYTKNDYNKAISVLEKGVELSKASKLKQKEGLCNYYLGLLHLKNKEFEKAHSFFEKTITLSQDLYIIINSAIYISEIYSNKGDYNSCFDILNKYFKISIKNHYKNGECYIYKRMGKNYVILGNYKKGLSFLNKSLKLSETLSEPYTQATILNDIGKAYQKTENYEKSIKYFLESVKLFNSLNCKDEEMKSLNSLSLSYYKQGKFEKAVQNSNKVLNLARETHNIFLHKIALSNLVKCYINLKEKESAVKYQEELISLKEKDDDADIKAEKQLLLELSKQPVNINSTSF